MDNVDSVIAIFLGAPGRPRRPLRSRLRTHTKPRGRQGEPVREVLHRRQHAGAMEANHDPVWHHPGK